MTMRLWHATVVGGFVGLVVGIVLQIGREIEFQHADGADLLATLRDSNRSVRIVCINGQSPLRLLVFTQMKTLDASNAYTDAHIAAYPIEYIAGIDLYNAGEFHAAHDAWEERWMGAVGPREKLFLQAMIQSAVAFHHLEIGRPGAARQMYTRAKEKFALLGCDVFMSLDLIDYQAQLDIALSWLLTVPDPRELAQPEIQPPRISLRSEISKFD